MTTKKFILFLLFVFFHLQFSTALSQIIVTIERPPLNQITVQDLWKLTLNNPTKETFTVYFKGTVDEPSQGKIYEGTSSEFQLKPGIQRVRISDLEITSNFYIKEYEEIIMRTGTAPEGNYQICVNVINTKNKAQIGRGCITHSIIAKRYIQLISPINSEVINQGTQIIFKHGSVVLQNDHSSETYARLLKKKYTIKIVEISKGQSPETAINNNPAFFKSESENLITIYPINARKFEANKTYAWNVTAYENNKEIATSDVWTFTIANTIPDLSTIELLSPSNNSIISIGGGINTHKIKFTWKVSDDLLNKQLSFNLRMVKVKEGQLFEEAINQNEPILEAKEIKNFLYEVFANKDTNKFDTTGRRPRVRLIHPGSVTGEIVYESVIYAWQVTAILPSGVMIPSEIFSFTCSVESTTVTSCGWPTLTDEFPVKSDETNLILNSWPGTTTTPVFVIPSASADTIYGEATGCYFIFNPWPPISPTCPWHQLYERGACWIASPDINWKSASTMFEKIIKKSFSLTSDATDVRIQIACDDRAEIYLDPSPTSLNSSNSGYIGTHNGYGTMGNFALPDLSIGNHELIIKLVNERASFYALIYGLEYTIISDPPEISVPEPRRTLCVDSETGTFEVRAGLTGRINRSCTTITFSQPDGTGSSLIYTSAPPTPNLNIEDLGTGGGERRYSIFIRENASDFLRNLNGYSKFCDTVLVTIRAGNSDCSRFSEYSWTMIIDADNRNPEINFVTPTITPTTINTFVEHSPRTVPPTFDLIPCTSSDGCYCIPFPIPPTFEIDILWASGLTSESLMLEVVFERQDPSPPYLITVQQLFDISRGGPLTFSLSEIPNGKRLSLNSSLISETLPTLQVGDCLKFIFHFPDSPCVCPTGYHQQAFKLKLGCP